jgi:hypothetical protein
MPSYSQRAYSGSVRHVVRRYQIFVGLRSEADRKAVEHTVGVWIEGATIVPSRGLWRGAVEDSDIIEIIVGDSHIMQSGHKIRAEMLMMGLAESLRYELGQEAVLVTSQKIDSLDGYGVDSYPWTFEDRVRNWLWDRYCDVTMWCMRNHVDTHLRLPWLIRNWLFDITD